MSILFLDFSAAGRRYHPRRATVKSIPASSEANIEPSIITCGSSPSSGGIWKLPASRRFASTHQPEPSNHRALAVRRRLLRKR